ncbi:SLC13 family permease [Owenweeksia hongkongensis]|uniref:SLC13 family permease n=1 Tax=Owenweeksia hongkongensis TaxID=253245 RepID=UPI003A947A1C
MKNRWISLAIGPLLFLICLALGGDNMQVRMIASVLWMLAWWIGGAIPVGVTALLPIILFPMLGILDLKATTANYANPVIYLFLGGFILGLAIEKWNLHKRIALNIINLSGEKPNRIILGSMLATALLSMWISNTATAVMMLPIGMSVVSLLGDKIKDGKAGRNFGITLMLGIAYSANIGGITTLIGTPPNLVLASIVSDSGLPPIDFSTWLIFALPLVIVLFTSTYLISTKVIFPIRLDKIEGIGTLIKQELKELGKLESGEKRVLIIMVSTALLWIFRAQLNKIEWLSTLSDTTIAILASVVLFVVPDTRSKEPLLKWQDTEKLPWGILLLFGGGISVAKGMEVTNIVELLGNWISQNSTPHVFVLVLIICALALFLTEVMSNVALVSVFIPVSFVIAQSFGLNELQLAIPLTIAASCAFMFPISTPPNAIVFSSGYLKMGDMAKTGILLNIASIIIISIYCYWFIPYFL